MDQKARAGEPGQPDFGGGALLIHRADREGASGEGMTRNICSPRPDFFLSSLWRDVSVELVAGSETGGLSDSGLRLPPHVLLGSGEKFCLQKWGPKWLFCHSVDRVNCKYFSFDFSRVKLLLCYSFKCSKKLALFMPADMIQVIT